MKVNTTDRRGGFTLMELGVVIAIVLIVTGVSLPTLTRAVNNARLKSSANSIASIYQQARMRAAQDDTYYEVIVTRAGAAQTRVCLDLNGDGVCQDTEPMAVLPPQVAVSNIGVPVPLPGADLGFNLPVNTENSVMYNQQNMNIPGLGINSRGVPCQRISSTSACNQSIEWVQYLQWQNAGNGNNFYAAVTVSPIGRVRVWTYSNSGNGNGTWQ